MTAWRNLLEPTELVDLFRTYPPLGFETGMDAVPLFHTRYDLLTTLEAPLRARLQRLPGFGLWSRLACWPTCFVGSTVTEYAPLPRELSPEELVRRIVAEQAPGQRLTILKDLPCRSPLLAAEDNDYADAVAAAALGAGFFELQGQGLAYVPVDTPSTEAYLARLSRARRKDLRRKLRLRDQLDVEVVPLGDARFADAAFCATLYAMYEAVYAQSEVHFDKLSPAFFSALFQRRDMEGLVVLYRREGRLLCWNLCCIDHGALVDKYIGFVYPESRDCHLYFISWLINLELARERGLHTYIAGWTDPEVKASLGASFTLTRHLVYVRQPLLRRMIRPFRHLFESDAQTLRAGTP